MHVIEERSSSKLNSNPRAWIDGAKFISVQGVIRKVCTSHAHPHAHSLGSMCPNGIQTSTKMLHVLQCIFQGHVPVFEGLTTQDLSGTVG
jgi:hypothetical protein